MCDFDESIQEQIKIILFSSIKQFYTIYKMFHFKNHLNISKEMRLEKMFQTKIDLKADKTCENRGSLGRMLDKA